MFKKIISLSIILLAIVFLSSCSVVTKRLPMQSTKNSKSLFRTSKKDLKRGKAQQAQKKLERILQEEPDSDLADDAAIELGHIFFKKRQYEKSYDYFMLVPQSDILSPKEIHAYYYASRSLFYLDRFDSASSLLNKALKVVPITKNLQLKVHTLLFQTTARQGDMVDSLRSIYFLSENHPLATKRSYYKVKAIKLIDQSLLPKDLNYVASQPDFGPLRGYAYYRLAEIHVEEQSSDDAIYYFQNVIRYLPGTDYALRAQKYLDQKNAINNVDGKTIGVILPLSGKYKRIGYKALRGIQLALGVFDNPRSSYKLAVIDSEGNPIVAQKAAEQLVIENEAIAIIGSLLSKTSNAVAQASHQFGVASIALSQKSQLNHLGDPVFQNALTSKVQIAHLTKVAMEDMNFKNFAILYPNEPYGVEFANIFWDFVLARGGNITGIQSYKPGETDFKAPIRRLVGTFYIEDRIDEYKHNLKEWYKQNPRISRRKQPPEDQLAPIKDFDAIFIPDTTKALGQIASMLHYNNVPDTYLLGTNIWNSRSLVRRNKSMPNTTVFVDVSSNNSNTDNNDNSFFQNFTDTFSSKPGTFEIRAYESAKILRSIIDSGVDSRSQVAERLKEIDHFPGVNGFIYSTPSGELTKPLQLFTIKNNRITELKTFQKN